MTLGLQNQEGTIRVTSMGDWLHDDAPVAEPVASLFWRHVTVGQEGHYVIDWQQQRQRVHVDDAAFFVRQVHVSSKRGGLKEVRLTLSDGTEELLDASTLMQSEENVLYCRIDRNGFSVPCRFDRAQYHALADWIEEGDDNFVLPLNNGAFPIQPYDDRPQRLRD